MASAQRSAAMGLDKFHQLVPALEKPTAVLQCIENGALASSQDYD
jgi:hypothetical protein